MTAMGKLCMKRINKVEESTGSYGVVLSKFVVFKVLCLRSTLYGFAKKFVCHFLSLL